MSYIKRMLEGGPNNQTIIDFLEKEGFKYGTGPFGYGLMYYVKGNEYYTAWLTIHEERIHCYGEYECGGSVADLDYEFDEDSFDSFMTAYYNAVYWAKNFLE